MCTYQCGLGELGVETLLAVDSSDFQGVQAECDSKSEK